jgi:hypothetical protein
VCRYYLGAYSSAQDAAAACAATAAALAAHRRAARVEGCGHCAVALPSGRVLVLVLAGGRDLATRDLASRNRSASTTPFAAGPAATGLAEGNKRPRAGSSSSSSSKAKAGRMSGGPARATARAHDAAAGEEQGGGDAFGSWSSEAAARCQRALLAHAAGDKVLGTSFATGDWAMAKWQDGLWFFAKVKRCSNLVFAKNTRRGGTVFVWLLGPIVS